MPLDMREGGVQEQLEAIVGAQHFRVPSETSKLRKQYKTQPYPIEFLYGTMANHRQVVLELTGYLLLGNASDKNFAKTALHSHYANISRIQAYPDKIVVTSTCPKGENKVETKTFEAPLLTQCGGMKELYKRNQAKKVNYSTKIGKARWSRLKALEKKYWENDPWNPKHGHALMQDANRTIKKYKK